MDTDILLYFKGITNKDLLSSTGNSAQSSVITLWSPGGRMGEGIVREFGMDMDTLLYLTWRSNKELLSRTGSSAQCHVAAWMGGEFGGRRDTCMAESLHRPPETVTTPLISRTCVHTKSLQPCLTPCDPMDHSPTGSSVHGESPGKNTESVSCHAFLQGIFPTQRSNCVGGRFFTTITSREACSPAIRQYEIKRSF